MWDDDTPHPPSEPDLDLFNGWFTLDEACQELRVSRYTLARRSKAGLIAVIREGRRGYIHRDELARYVASLRAAATAEAAARRTNGA